MKFTDFLIDLVYPKKCLFCDKELPIGYENSYCEKCFLNVKFIDENKCLKCGRSRKEDCYYKVCNTCSTHKIYFDVNYALFIYDGLAKEMIKRYKFNSKAWYAKHIATFLYENFKDKILEFDYILYPPINKKTFQKRGYNQMELIANYYSKMCENPVLKNALLKKREYEKQSLVKGDERFKNVKDAFCIKKKYVDILNNKKVLILDDVLTTGATLSECAKVLKNECKVSSVITMTIAATHDM